MQHKRDLSPNLFSKAAKDLDVGVIDKSGKSHMKIGSSLVILFSAIIEMKRD